MRLIKEIEISYFRSFYKANLKNLKDYNIIFGKNDSGKSNIIRALNLFFNNKTERYTDFDFNIDFNDKREKECIKKKDARKFIYVKITFNTPESFKKSLGEEFYVKRQWTVSRGNNYIEEIPKKLEGRGYLVSRLLNKIKFVHVPAIKTEGLFADILENIYDAISERGEFKKLINNFASEIKSGLNIFNEIPKEISERTTISAPANMRDLFSSLDFEVRSQNDLKEKSLIKQKGDGIKVRHIPELLNFIMNYDNKDYHIWGFEEPENSLDFAAAESESKRLLENAKKDNLQIFLTTHNPYFYMAQDAQSVSKYYVIRKNGESIIKSGKEIDEMDPEKELNNGFYLPKISEYIESLKKKRDELDEYIQELNSYRNPILIVEGETDKIIIETAINKLNYDFGCGLNIINANGADNIYKIINTERYPISEKKIIGLFDGDGKGLDKIKDIERKLKFDKINIMDEDIYRSENLYALRLPCPEFREKCLKYRNFYIEHFFEDNYLQEVKEGKGLVFEKIEPKINGVPINIDIDNCGICCMKISNGKKFFAENICQEFPKDAFSNFKKLFDIIKSIINN